MMRKLALKSHSVGVATHGEPLDFADNRLQIEIDASDLLPLLAQGVLTVKQLKSLNHQTKHTLWYWLLKRCQLHS